MLFIFLKIINFIVIFLHQQILNNFSKNWVELIAQISTELLLSEKLVTFMLPEILVNLNRILMPVTDLFDLRDAVDEEVAGTGQFGRFDAVCVCVLLRVENVVRDVEDRWSQFLH